MSSSDGNIYINDLTTGNELSPFELVTDSTTNPTTSLITPNTTKAGYAVESTSFVVGSDRLDNDNNAENKKDTRMFFDKPKGAFRAGTVTGNQWNDVNRGTNSTALGSNNIARGENSFAAGNTNIANGTNSFAAGISNTVNGDSSVAAGNNNNTNGDNSVAIGFTNIVSNSAPASVSAAIGASNQITTSSTGSFAIGKSNYASGPGNQSVLIGVSNTTVDGDNGVAIGEYNTTSADNATAIGQYCTASGTNSVSIGYGTSSANNTAGVPGITGSIAIGNTNSSTGADSVAIGKYCTASGSNSFAIGYGDIPGDSNSIRNIASGNGSFAIGNRNKSYGSNSIAIGQYCTAGAIDGSGSNSVAIGYGTSGINNTAGNTGSVSIGYQNDSTGHNSVAIGSNNAATGDGSVAIGTGCDTQAAIGAICMGYNAAIDIQYGVANAAYNFFWNGDTVGNNVYASAPGSACFRLGRDNNINGIRYSEFRIEIPMGTPFGGTLNSGVSAWVNSTSNGWQFTSDINLKENLVEQNYSDILTKIMEMPIYTYNFKGADHINKCFGPVAQDFNRLFVTNCNPLGISSSNLASITLSGVKGVKLGLDSLSTSVDSRFASNSDATSALQSRIAVLESSLTTASAQITAMESRLAALEQ